MHTPQPMSDGESFRTTLAELESVEDFLAFFGIDYDAHVVNTSRLHIMQRLHDYLGPQADHADFAHWQTSLRRAYQDFVQSDTLTEGVFRVFKRARGITTIPLSTISWKRA